MTKNIKSVLKNIYVGLFPIIILLVSVLYKEAELSYQQLEGSKHILVGVLYLICFLLLTSISAYILFFIIRRRNIIK